MADHSEFVTMAQELIAEDGRLVSFLKLSNGAADPNKPWNGTGAPSVEQQVDNVPAVFLPASGGGLGSVVKDDELLKRVEQVALVAPHAQDLSAMTAMLDGEQYRIEWVQVLKPADRICLYVFGVKR